MKTSPLHQTQMLAAGGDWPAVVSTLQLPSRREQVFTANGADAGDVQQLLSTHVKAAGAQAMGRFCFAGQPFYAGLGTGLKEQAGALLQFQRSAPPGNPSPAAVQIMAIADTSSTPVLQDGRQVGLVYEDDDARCCRLSGVVPANLGGTREEQTLELLQTLERLLAAQGFRFTDTIRTWFYLDQLLDWYKPFNTVRTGFFRERGIFEHLVPASTGIGIANAQGAALTCDLLAVQPKHGGVRIEAVASPEQDSALKYASSFSRAVEWSTPGCRSLYISGSASIDRDGKSQYVGDHVRQIERTLQVVAALLQSRGMGWADATRGIAYFVDLADVATFTRLARDLGIPPFPLALVHADVCRHDLLFELELDAAVAP